MTSLLDRFPLLRVFLFGFKRRPARAPKREYVIEEGKFVQTWPLDGEWKKETL